MKVVAVDPGDVTGVAVFENGKLVYTISFPVSTEHTIAQLLDLIATVNPDSLIIEKPPQNNRNRKLAAIYYGLELWANTVSVEIVTYFPGNWKPVMKKRGRTEISSTHERDAADMGKYHLAKG